MALRPVLSRAAFTLVELLVVMAIIAVILVTVVPRFDDIGRGSKMRAAVSELRSTIMLARQWAIAHRTETYLMLPDDYATLYSGLSTDEYAKALRSYAVYTVHGTNKVYMKDWTYLPRGVFFVDQHNENSTFSDSRLDANNNAFREGTIRQLPFPLANSANRNINAIIFRPDGTLDGITPFELFLAEGVALDGLAGKVVNVIFKGNGGDADGTLWGMEINPFTGSVQVNDYSQ